METSPRNQNLHKHNKKQLRFDTFMLEDNAIKGLKEKKEAKDKEVRILTKPEKQRDSSLKLLDT